MGDEVLGTVLGIIGALTGVAGLVYARLSTRQGSIDASTRAFQDARRAVNADRASLADAAAREAAADPGGETFQRVAGSSLLSKPSWMFATPLPLSDIQLAPLEHEFAPPISDRLRRLIGQGLPEHASGRYPSYTAAIQALAAPTGVFENRESYRLLDFTTTPAPGEPHMRFSLCRYFDMLDVGEPLAMEFALSPTGRTVVPQPSRRRIVPRLANAGALPLRRELGDPTDLSRHPVLPAVNTLTIRLTPQGSATFFLHKRGADDVPVAAGQLHVIPCGGFQPSAQNPVAVADDYNLWRSMSREYAEELLGLPEAFGAMGDQLDYESTSPYAELMAGVRNGTIRPWIFGAAFDPLSYYVEVLTATVFDSAVFDAVFPQIVDRNPEGSVVKGKDGRGLDFTEATVQQILRDTHMAPAGYACLSLGWQHRATLLGTAPH